jgi:hypothetical protein
MPSKPSFAVLPIVAGWSPDVTVENNAEEVDSAIEHVGISAPF